MALENKISQTMSADSLKKITDAITVIKNELPYLLNLSTEDRKALLKMGDKTVAFVQKANEYARQNPQVVPAFLNMVEFDKDVQLILNLNKVLYPLEQLTEKIDDTTKIAGSEAYAAALVFYTAAKAAAKAGVPGMKGVVDDLAVRFPGRSAAAPTADSDKK